MTPPIEHEPLSVVMPVHNALPHLYAAVRSILDQSWRDFEFVIFDDGSTDGSAERLREWASRDSRIRLVRSETNLGPVSSSNEVVKLAKARLIARMDADDISHPDRLKLQLEVLERCPEVGLIGTMHDTIDPQGRKLRGPNYWRLFQKNWFVPFAHGSIMYRREIFDQLGGYREECVFWEDQDFFVRASTITKVVTLSAPLYQHRHSAVSTRLASDQARVEQSVDLMYRSVDRLYRDKGYDDLLRQPRGEDDRKVDPRVFISLGSITLWAGGRPGLFRRLLSHGKLGLDGRSASALVWTAWASLAPSTLRAFMRMLASMKNSAVSRKTLETRAVEWRTRSRPRASLPAGEGVPGAAARQ